MRLWEIGTHIYLEPRHLKNFKFLTLNYDIYKNVKNTPDTTILRARTLRSDKESNEKIYIMVRSYDVLVTSCYDV